jgi:YtkA-like protein
VPRRSLTAGVLLCVAPVLLAACGTSTAATITVGDVAPAAAPALPVATVEVGPAAVRKVLTRAGYRLTIRVSPNRATRPNRVVVGVSQDGMPVTGARVTVSASMLTMDMGTAQYELHGSGTYSAHTPAWLMPGLWELAVRVRPPGGPAIAVGLVDQMRA